MLHLFRCLAQAPTSDHLSWNNWLTLSLFLYTYLLFWERVSSYRATCTCTRISLVGAGWVSSSCGSFLFYSFLILNHRHTAGEMMSFVSLLFPRERERERSISFQMLFIYVGLNSRTRWEKRCGIPSLVPAVPVRQNWIGKWRKEPVYAHTHIILLV